MTEEIKRQGSPQRLTDLVSAPLIAAAEANAKMSQAQVDFLLECCFTKNGDSYAPKMIQLELTRGVITPAAPGEIDQATQMVDATTSFNLPLLTIVPLNSLAVNNVDVNFEMDITHLDIDAQGEPQLLGKVMNNAEIEGFKMDIAIHAGQIPLAAGLLTIIDAFSKNVQPTNH